MVVPRIVIDISGGVASILTKPMGVEIVVVDWDQIDEAEPGHEHESILFYRSEERFKFVDTRTEELINRADTEETTDNENPVTTGEEATEDGESAPSCRYNGAVTAGQAKANQRVYIEAAITETVKTQG